MVMMSGSTTATLEPRRSLFGGEGMLPLSRGLTTATTTSPTAIRMSRRHTSLSAFTAAVEHLQTQHRSLQSGSAEDKQSRLHQVLRQGKQLYDTDKIDDVARDASPEVVARLVQVAAQWRVSPLRGQPFAELLNWASTPAAEEKMDIASLARILHSALVLRAPQLYPLLMTYIPFIQRTLASNASNAADAATLAVLINAYGRAGVQHDGLYQQLCEVAVTALRDPGLSIAHVANVSHALSKVRVRHPALLATLRDQAVRQRANATPLMSITLLNAFAELQFVDDELFCVYEQHLLEHLKGLTPPLLASLLQSLVTAGRSSSSLVERIGEQVVRTAGTFDAFAIAKVVTAYFAAGQFSEEVLGALAERACGVVADFRSEELAGVLEALSAFDLFDGELFPLLAARFAALVKQAAPVTIEDAATVLASFAAVQEPNDELHHWCGKVFAEYADASVLSAQAYINVIWGCMTLNIRNEAQKKFVEMVKASPQLLIPLDSEAKTWHKQKKIILEERRAKLMKAYGISAPAETAGTAKTE